MKHVLRPYQQDAVDAVISRLGDCPILVAPTGSGKTTMAVDLVDQLGRRTLWLAHRKELIDQAAARVRAHGLNAGIIMAGYPYEPLYAVQVASVQTLVRRDKPPAELIVVDECHHATADGYQSILEAYPGVPRVGLTATPFRLDGRGLGDLFGTLVEAASTADLVDAGFLHAPKVYASKSPDLRGVRVTAGDYNLKALSQRTDTAEQNADIVETWKQRAAGKRTVCFAVDVEHSQHIVEAFRRAGVPAEHLDGKTSRDERDAILARLRDGVTHVVSNCMVLTEGWDLPALECCIIARPTASLNLHLQMIGRIMRAAEGKDSAIVLDHAGNHHVHGLVTRRLEYSLDGDTKVGFNEPLGLKRCSNCGLFFDVGLEACPECGWKPAPAAERDTVPIHGGGELVEFDDSDFEYRRMVWNSIEAERQAMFYQEGWSAYRFKERFGVWPATVAGDLVDVHDADQETKQAVYEEFLQIASEKGYKKGWASYKYKDVFGVWPKGFVRKSKRRAEMQERMAAYFEKARQ